MLRAIHFPDAEKHRQHSHPGSVHFSGGGMRFYCPCGCGQLSRISVAEGAKPDETLSWAWNGSTSEPTLAFSVKQSANGVCKGWHGWLRSGYWESC